MTSQYTPARHRRTLAAALTAAVLTILSLISALPARAHDVLTDTSPAAGSTVTTAPATVTLTLTEPPTDTKELNLSTITVTDPAGTVISNGKVTVNGSTIGTAVKVTTNGTHTVKWRAAPSDGHPIEGSYTFTVNTSAVNQPTAPAATTAPPAATESAAPADPAQASAGQEFWQNFIIVAAVLTVIAFGLTGYVIYVRRKLRNSDTDAK